jgi:class III cytochrome C family protein
MHKRKEDNTKTNRGLPAKLSLKSVNFTKITKTAKKIVIFSTIITLTTTFGIIVSHAQKALDEGPETITLSDYAGSVEAVTFVHKSHGSTGEVGANCTTCHHKANKFITPGKCSKCHKMQMEEEVPNYSHAFHKLCIGCHKEEIVAGNDKISLSCDSCHVP